MPQRDGQKEPASQSSPLLSVSEAAAHLGTTERFVRRMVAERRCRYFKVGKFLRFRQDDLDAFVAQGVVNAEAG